MKKKLLFITPELPYPLHSGGKADPGVLGHLRRRRALVDMLLRRPLQDEQGRKQPGDGWPGDKL